MDPNIIALVVLILGVIAEGVKRAWAKSDVEAKKELEFEKQREAAIRDDDRYNRYNRK